MSFTLNRSNTFLPIKKNLIKTGTITPTSLKASIGSTGSSEFIILDTLSLNNETINANSTQLNYLQVSAGIAEKLKALVLNSSRNITNIGSLTCLESITVNGITITNNNDIPTGSSDDANNSFLTNIQTGIAKENKVLVSNSKFEITNINKLELNNLKIKNFNLNLSDNIYHLDNIKKLAYPSNISVTENLLSNFIRIGSTENFYRGGTWSCVCWSQELNIFVAVASSNTIQANISKIMYSSNGTQWISSNDILQTNGYNSVCWASELDMFIAVGNSLIVYSYDGINWMSSDLEYLINLQSVCWSPELNLFVAVGNSNNTGRVLISNNGLNWNLSTSGVYLHNWSSICWANTLNLFVATAISGTENIYRIMVSNDGNNWEIVKHSLFTNTSINNIIWSEELNMLLATSSTTSRIIYSYDGFIWNSCFSVEVGSQRWSFNNISSIIWIKDLHIFVATLVDFNKIFISYDGIKWNELSFSFTHNFVALAWSPSNGLVMINNNTNESNRVCINKTFTSKSIINNEILSISSNNNIGINTKTPNSRLEINSTDGNCLKILRSAWNLQTNFNVRNNGIFDIIATNYSTNNSINVNIQTNLISHGLKLNNVLLRPNITEYSYLSNITNGIGQSLKVLVTDENNNISNINQLSCSSLTINGEIYNLQANNVLSNITNGIASESKALFTDNNINIKNINTLSVNNYGLNYDNYYGSNTNETININKLKNKYTQYQKIQNLNSITASNWNLISNSSAAWNDICYAPELNLFVIVGSGSNLFLSNDARNWRRINLGITSSFNINKICWSPYLKMFVAIVNSNTSFSAYISYNGVQWQQSKVFVETGAFFSVIWANELKLFVIVKSSGTPRCFISNDGINWHRGGIDSSQQWSSVCWVNKLGLLVACSNSSPTIATSPNGINWSYIQNPNPQDIGFRSICWSEELNMIIAYFGSQMIYSYNATNWFGMTMPNTINNMVWSSSLQMFIGCASFNNFSYSYDGLNWLSFLPPTSNQWNNLLWVNELSMLITISLAGTERIAYTIIQGLVNNTANMFSHKTQLYFNKNNGNLGLGTMNPNYQLELSTDSAAKPTTTTWNVSSDSRLKENIENANLDTCYNIIKSLKLKRYKWKDSIFNEYQIKDRIKLGWIADEVQDIFPKAVETKNAFGLIDCKILNIEQIIASIYGCTQKLINEYDNLDNLTYNIDYKLNVINDFINKLE